jgi:hypothetical protein
VKGFAEEFGEEEERRSLVEAVPGRGGDETAAAACEGVLLEKGYGEASFGEAGSG